MNRLSRFFGTNSGEDQMDVDMDFTERYLSEFESIDRQVIDVLIENGYQNKEQLLAFDIVEDLPVLPDLNMAQKSVLRKALKQLHESEELETKIYDLKGDDVFTTTSPSVMSTKHPIASKRKLESTPRSSSPKRLRSTARKTTELDDSVGPKMRQMVSARKSIRRYESSQTESEHESEFTPTVDTNRLRNRSMNRSYVVSPVNDSALTVSSDDEEEEEEEEEVPQVMISRKYQSMSGRQQFGGLNLKLTARKSIGGPAPRKMPSADFLRKSIVMPSNSKTETTPKTPPKTSSPSPYVPTPTELEVRERLAQKQALGKQKAGRKRR